MSIQQPVYSFTPSAVQCMSCDCCSATLNQTAQSHWSCVNILCVVGGGKEERHDAKWASNNTISVLYMLHAIGGDIMRV